MFPFIVHVNFRRAMARELVLISGNLKLTPDQNEPLPAFEHAHPREVTLCNFSLRRMDVPSIPLFQYVCFPPVLRGCLVDGSSLNCE